jgi:hypothetical protein
VAQGAFGVLGTMAFGDLLGIAPARPPKASRVLCFHMEGGPVQLDLWDDKPGLVKRFDKDLPDSVRNGQRITGMTSGQSRLPVAPSIFKFTRRENADRGVWLSELVPHLGGMAKDLCFVHSMHTDAINHEPGITFFQTGSQLPGRPSFGRGRRTDSGRSTRIFRPSSS